VPYHYSLAAATVKDLYCGSVALKSLLRQECIKRVVAKTVAHIATSECLLYIFINWILGIKRKYENEKMKIFFVSLLQLAACFMQLEFYFSHLNQKNLTL